MKWVTIMFLREVELINFMCHEYLKFIPKKITLLFGRNGSGKSAVLEAISLAFGGLGRERQDLLRNFIKHGKEVAIIRIRIANTISLPGRGIVVLDSNLPHNADIVIERIITYDNSYYKLNGKKVTREKIIQILSKINISPRNAFYFIPQEKITKLVDLKPKERLDMLLASLGLHDLKVAIEKLRADLKNYLNRKKELEAKIDDLRKKIEEYRQLLKSTEISLRTLRNYYVYKLALLFRKLKAVEEEEEKIKLEKNRIENTIKNYIEFIETVPERLEKIDLEIEKLHDKKIEISNRILEIEKEESTINDKIKALTRKLSDLNAKRNDVMRTIQEILNRWGVKSSDDLISLLSDKKARLKDIEEALERFDETRKMKELENTIHQKEREIREVEALRKEYNAKIEEILKELDPASTVLRIYRFIQRRKLADEIFGPMVLEISFSIPMNKLWGYSKALERILREKISKSFVALSWRALERTLEFVKKENIIDIPPMFFFGSEQSMIPVAEQYAFFLRKSIDEIDKKYKDFKESILEKLNELPDYRRRAFLALVPDIISAPRPVLAIIKLFLGKIALVSRLEEGLYLLSVLNLDGIITLEGEFVEKIPCGDGYAVYRMLPPLRSEEGMILHKLVQFDIRNFREKDRAFLEAIEKIREEIGFLKKSLGNLKLSLPRRLKSLFEERMRLKENIVKLEEDIAFLNKARSERAKLPVQIKEIEIRLEKFDERLRIITSEKQKLEEELQSIDFRIVELEQKKDSLIRERSKLEVEIEELKEKLAEISIRMDAVEDKKEKILGEIERLKKEIKALLAVIWASIYGKSNENLDSILAKEIVDPAMKIISRFDISQLEEVLARYSKRDIENLRYDIVSREEKVRMLEDALKQLDKYQEELRNVESEIESSRKLAKNSLEKLIDKLHTKVSLLNENYKYVLSKIGAKGEIKIEGKDIDNLELLIMIDLHRPQPVEISRGAFSSGEKTLAIFAFLMALFLTSPAPILLLDEFDVYLDEAVMREAARLLKRTLADMKYVQCILTTTHRLALIRIADKIIQLVYDSKRKTSYASEIDKEILEGVVRRGVPASIL